MDREQLEALRRQVEEDYKLDIAAIERLQRRFQSVSSSAPSSIPGSGLNSTLSSAPGSIPAGSLNATLSGAPARGVPASPYSSQSEWSNFESRVEPPSPAPLPPKPTERRIDELEGSLRTMFNTGRK